MLIYANGSHLLPSAVPVCVCVLSAHVSLIGFVLCVTGWWGYGCRYFGDQIRDVFTQEDFQLYR